MRQIGRDLHACLIGQTPVILNIASERYQLVRGPTRDHLTALLATKPGPENIAALVRAGLLDPAIMDAEGAAAPVAPTCSHLDLIKLRHGWLLAPVALVALSIAVIQVRRDALRTILDRVEVGAGRPRLKLPIFSEAMVAAAFYLLRQFLPLDNHCLARSIAISRMLRRFGHQANLVIGVQLPIAAHCWVQCEDRLMADRVDRITAFEPILAR